MGEMATRRFGWFAWILVGGVVLAGVALASALALRAYAPALTRERLESELTEALRRPVRIEGVTLSLWRGRAVIRNLRVESGPGVAEPLLRLGRLELSVGISSLWRRELVLSKILLRDLGLNIPFPDSPPLSIDFPETVAIGPVTARIGTIEVEQARVTYRDPESGLTLEVQNLRGAARLVRRGVDATLHLDTFILQAGGVREIVTDVDGAGWIHNDSLSLRKFTGRWLDRPVQLAGEVRRPLDTPELALRVRGEFDLAKLSQRFKSPAPFAGVAIVDGTLQGRPDALEASGRVTTATLRAGPVQARDVSVRGRWSRGTLDLSEVTAHLFNGTLRGSVATRPDHLEATRIAFSLEHASLAALDALAPTPIGLGGDLDFEGEFTGDPRRPVEADGRFRLAARRLTLPGDLHRIGPGTLNATGMLRNAVAELADVTGRWAGIEVEASGRLSREGPAGLRFRLGADLGALAPLLDIRHAVGQARLAGEANGRWDDPEIAAQVRAPAITLAGVTVETIEASLRFRGKTLRVDSVAAGLGQSRAIASGSLTWDGPGDPAKTGGEPPLRFQADLRAPVLHWEDLDRWLPPAWQGSGRIALSGRLEGTPAAWRGAGSVEAAGLTAGSGIPIRDLQGAFSLTQDRIDVSRLQADVDGIPCRGAGGWAWNGSGQATAELGPADLARIPDLPPEAALRGTVRARVQASIRQGVAEVSGTAAAERVAIRGFSLGDGSAQFTLRGGEVRAEATFPEMHLSATARGQLDRKDPLAVRIEARDLALGPILRGIDQVKDSGLDGTVTALAEFLIPASQPSAARGTLTLDPVRLTLVGEEWTNRGPVSLRWEPTGLQVERLTLASRLGRLQASGRLDPHGPLGLQVDGQFPLGTLAAFRPEIREAGGTLTVTGQVAGTASAPRFAGEAAVRNGTLQLRERPETLREVEARVVLSPEGLRLIEATGSLGRGRIRASGDLTLEGWRLGAYRFSLTGQNVSLTPVEGLQTTWDCNLELVGRGTKAQLRGEGRLLQGTASGRFSLLSLLLSHGPEKAVEASGAIPLRILLRLGNNLRVNMNLARLQAGGTLSLEGTTAEPVLLGALETQEGRITFRNQRWNLVSGAARFVDPRHTEMILDVTGQSRIKDYDVTLRLAGRPDELSVTLSSSPTLPQDELLYLVALGTSKREAGKSPEGAALGEMVRLLAADLLGLTMGGLGPDQISMEKTDKNQQIVHVGGQLTEDVRMLYSQSISGSAKRVLRIEYQMVGPLLLAGEQDFQGGVGGDLLLRLRFR